MKRFLRYIGLTVFFLFAEIQRLLAGDFSAQSNEDSIKKDDPVEQLYNILFQNEQKPVYEAFALGFEGYLTLKDEGKLENPEILTIIDYSKPSNERRLWVIDVENQTIIHNTLVAHGRNSGEALPTKFSNIPNSNMSSQGFFLTGETYYGKHGYSLKIDGIEQGINDKARQRAIVIHSADYVSLDFAKKNGRLGRSFGCPALPPAKNQIVIDSIKNQSCLFIYSIDPKYTQKSKIAKKALRI